jgi:hypothetical protein
LISHRGAIEKSRTSESGYTIGRVRGAGITWNGLALVSIKIRVDVEGDGCQGSLNALEALALIAIGELVAVIATIRSK